MLCHDPSTSVFILEPVVLPVVLTVVLTVSVFNKGEPFSQEEINEMLTALADQDTNHIYYKDYIGQLTVDTDV